jgi:hypothetical protein
VDLLSGACMALDFATKRARDPHHRQPQENRSRRAATRYAAAMKTSLALLALVSLLGACGGGNSTGSCDQRQVSSMACLDYNSPSADVIATYKSACTAPQVWSDSPCPHSGSVGGCQAMYPSPTITITTWFYGSMPYTSATIMSACAQSHSTYVAP